MLEGGVEEGADMCCGGALGTEWACARRWSKGGCVLGGDFGRRGDFG